jgi:Domain of unknown function (DUF3127)
MIIKGKITAITALEQGINKNNEPWQKKTVVIEYETEPYIKQAAVEVWGEHCNHPALKLENNIIAHIDILAKLHVEKYYNTLRAWRILPSES